MKKELPRLLLVSEASLDRERTGLNRTLLNLLEDYPVDRFMLYTPKESLKNFPTSPPLNQNIAVFPERFIPQMNNRFGTLLNPIFQTINFQLLDWLPLVEQEKIAAFSPQVILICPVGTLGLLMGYKVAQSLRCPFITYFMDNWAAFNHLRWFSGNVQQLCHFVLKQASGWLMISSQLEKQLMKQYQIVPKRSHIVHNPVNIRNKKLPDFVPYTSETFKIVYAGAIWPMHYDAIAVVAEAIYELRQSGVNIELILHTPLNFWHLYQKSWETWEVTYGSLIPYEQLNDYLQKANLLLVASSFLPEYAHMISSSVQTKLTDYMASGKPILTCEPSYGACNEFIKTWKCGVVCETNQITKIKEILLEQLQNTSELYQLAKNGFEVVNNHFETNIVRNKLYDFIQKSTIF